MRSMLRGLSYPECKHKPKKQHSPLPHKLLAILWEPCLLRCFNIHRGDFSRDISDFLLAQVFCATITVSCNWAGGGETASAASFLCIEAINACVAG
jgi:hypothetical protein